MSKAHRRIAYTTSLKNPLTWLSALLALAALVGFILRAARRSAPVTGCWTLWLCAIVPALAALFFAYQLLVRGRDRVYRLSLPFWALALEIVCLALREGPWYLAILCIVVALGGLFPIATLFATGVLDDFRCLLCRLTVLVKLLRIMMQSYLELFVFLFQDLSQIVLFGN